MTVYIYVIHLYDILRLSYVSCYTLIFIGREGFLNYFCCFKVSVKLETMKYPFSQLGQLFGFKLFQSPVSICYVRFIFQILLLKITAL